MSSPYTIPLCKSGQGVLTYRFPINKQLFALFPHSLVRACEGVANVSMQRVGQLLHLDFDIRCETELVCDRTLRSFTESLHVRKRLIVKLAETYDMIDENTITLPASSQEIDLKQSLYDYISLSLPMKKLHPSLRASEATRDDDEDLHVYASNRTSSSPDPRWRVLQEKEGQGSP